jgi:hypothetical protein
MLTALPNQIHFGTLSSTGTAGPVERSFTVCRYDNSPLEISSVDADFPGVEFTIVPHDGADIQTICDIKAVVDPKKFCLDRSPGRVFAKVFVRTRHKDYVTLTVPVIVNVE